MAFSMKHGGGRGRRGGFESLGEINIIPLVDVVLVLLIIFMLTAHVMEFGLEVDVPKVRQVRNSAETLPVVTISKDGEMKLNEKDVNINEVGDVIKQKFPGQKAVYVRADKATPWDPIAQVVSELGQAKLDVRMVTQPVDEAGRRK
ncbi:MAG TPA: biopolymer transporter ExbD [Bryobacteraceae bacterium]|nr:biopolymer transporter ExbD [Bryobacteraceae bacterium]